MKLVRTALALMALIVCCSCTTLADMRPVEGRIPPGSSAIYTADAATVFEIVPLAAEDKALIVTEKDPAKGYVIAELYPQNADRHFLFGIYLQKSGERDTAVTVRREKARFGGLAYYIGVPTEEELHDRIRERLSLR